MKKRRQHYVWRHYLSAWAADDLIWCMGDGRIFNPNIRNVAQERDFYRLKELSTNDIEFVTRFIVPNQPPLLQTLNRNWISLFNAVFEIRKIAVKHGISSEQLDAQLDIVINNSEEDLHGAIEENAIEHLSVLRKHDIARLKSDEAYMQFIHYLCVQYFRTRAIRDAVISNVQGDKLLGVLNPEAIWGVLRHILATNLGWTLFVERRELKPVLIINNTVESFLTADQPVINTHATGVSPSEFANDLEFFYPLTPQSALLVTKDRTYADVLTVNPPIDVIQQYNRHIIEQSHRQVYGASKEVLQKYFANV